jgi:hypothetical protein
MQARSITVTATAFLLTAGFAVVPALAQSSPPGAPAVPAPSSPAPASTTTTPPAGTPAPTTAVQAPRGKRAEARAEKWISDLHSRLRITAAEQPQWDALAQVMRENAMHTDQVFAQEQGNPAKATALDEMRAYAIITEAHAEDMQKLLPAFETLYNAMTPEQKLAADAVFRQYARQGLPRRAASR